MTLSSQREMTIHTMYTSMNNKRISSKAMKLPSNHDIKRYADTIGMIFTVSRVVSSKYVLTPYVLFLSFSLGIHAKK